jgi:hypothetical protein
MSPSPKPEAAVASLGGGGTWHTQDWVGAVLPGSHLGAEPKEQVHAFLDSAIVAARAIQKANDK